ncbi:hypothetical protein [Rhodobacter capsulatus]|uniref:hypothetical protein n=1 Tax=Rhodobacter capsulatus TaxID=1061 RepID=UPI00402A52F2
MMTRFLFALLLPGAVILSGCSGSTDPETAHLFDNMRNLNNGEYDRQIAAKDAEAAAIIRNNNSAQARIGGLQSQTASNAQAIASLKSQIAAVRGEAAAARAQVAGNPAKLAQLNALEGQINAVQADVEAGGDIAVTRAELRRLSASIRALAR